MQVALRSKGFYTGAVDGISGPQTRDALLRFQRKHGIRATGKIGMATRCKLGKLGTPLLGQRQLPPDSIAQVRQVQSTEDAVPIGVVALRPADRAPFTSLSSRFTNRFVPSPSRSARYTPLSVLP